jgi:thymidylate synthase
VTGLVPGEFIHSFGDAHIYTNHLEQVDEQLGREPFPLPRVEIDPAVSDLARVSRDQIRLFGYRSHPPLKGEVAV